MTTQEFLEVFTMLETAYPTHYKKLTNTEKKRSIELWSSLFRNYDSGLVKKAVMNYISSDKSGFPPVPGQITEIIHALLEPDSMTDEEAWKLVEKAISNGNYNAEEEFNDLPKELQRAVGSPNLIRNYAMFTPKELQYVKKDIMDSYRYAKTCERNQKINNMLAIEADRVATIESNKELPFTDIPNYDEM